MVRIAGTEEAAVDAGLNHHAYVRCWAGFVHVAFILDVFAQRIVAWHAATSKDTDLVMTPLRMAIWQRDHEGHPVLPGELIGHADAGSQYTSTRFTEHLELEGVRPSIGLLGDAFDNALMKSVVGLYKTECIRTTVFPRRALPDHRRRRVRDLRLDRLVQRKKRRHGSLGMLNPVEYETAHYATLDREPQPT